MSARLSHKISFDAEDRPPPSYYGKDNLENSLKSAEVKKKINEEEWVKAPEFVPRPKVVEKNRDFGNPPFAYQTTFINESSCTPPDLTAPSPSGLPCMTPQFVASLPQPILRHPQHHIRPHFFPLPLLPPGFLPLVGPMAGINNTILGNGGLRLPMRPQIINQHGLGKGPLRPNIALSKTLQSAGAKNNTGIPPGYTANVTTFNSGMGPPIPAIVLKKKRKKRNKNKTKEWNTNVADNGSEGKDSSPDTVVEMSKRSSEPDLTKIINPSHEADMKSHTHKFQNDPDVIQTAVEAMDTDNCMLTGSCPDLSQAQRDYFEQFWDECVDNDKNAGVHDEFNGFTDHTSTDIRVNPFNQSNTVIGHDDYDVASPAVFNAMQDAATEGNIRSAAVRALDKQIVSEMGLVDKLQTSYIADDDEEEDDGEERLYERLIKDTNQRLKEKPTRAPNSLMDEMEEGEYLTSQHQPSVHHSAAYLARNGISSAQILDKQKHGAFDSYYPSCTYIEEENMHGMHITVNAFQDPEELIIDDDQGDQPSRMSKLQGAFTKLKASISEPQLYPPPKPCCAIM